jgi:DNA-binding PadR family transcriptional regulator
MVRVRQPGLLLGEWACLGALGAGRLHGFAIARRLAPGGDLGRVWSLSRPLTYRAIGTISSMGLIRPTSEEPGEAGPNRTVLGLTPKGRSQLRSWLATPVLHPRDVRGELLLKIVLCDDIGVERGPLVRTQLEIFERHWAERRREAASTAADPVAQWRAEFAAAAVRFLQTLESTGSPDPAPPGPRRASNQ